MKYLFLIRHAKSSWSDPGRDDFDRPLNKRGKRDAVLMGERLAALGRRPELILSSPAKRARRTARAIGAALGFEASEIVLDQALYTFSWGPLLEVVQSAPDRVSVLGVVGHNHGLTECAERLTGTTLGNVPTCGLVLIGLNQPSWRLVKPGGGELLVFDYPKRPGAGA